ncbi:MAG: glycoside hydrolase family 32 protein [Chthoniobacterales bacterium]|nr:glycoside hydrolase family 32 protein [Chthoniobacterales bacterium]
MVAASAICVFAQDAAYQERFRPQFHFTPERNWMNDPNGMVFWDGEYHLFYQYNPFGDKWGHMSWAHAVSRDLVRWEHLPLALPEDGDIMIFSGSAVVDTKNTSGFGNDALVAIYTGHNEKAKEQDQRLAYSTDRGRTWTQFPGNPVLKIGAADFRDPKVAWHEPTGKWIMVVAMATEKKIRFYGSPNLKDWAMLSEFGPAGATGGLWECPDLFELPVAGGESKWVLIVNLNPGAIAGGSGCQYFVGEFDGKSFRSEYPAVGAPHSQGESGMSHGVVLAEFEDFNYVGWTATEGEAFKGGAVHPEPSSDVRGFEGQGLADSFGGADEHQGVLVSQEFQIEADHISFLIGGGNYPDLMGLNLVVDGKVVRTATGNNSPVLVPMTWDVSELRGKTAHLEVFDRFDGTDWGHILVDHIVMGEEPPSPQSDGPALWADYGRDFYAAVTWSDIPRTDGRRIMLGWMSNWDYADKVPTTPWRGVMTVPRTLGLVDTRDGIRLTQQPVVELQGLWEGQPKSFPGGSFADAASWLASQRDLSELLDVEMQLSGVSGANPFEVSIQTGNGEATVIGVDAGAGKIFVDRAKSGASGFHPSFANRTEAPLHLNGGKLKIRWLLDTSSLEVFVQDGLSVLTNLIFPAPGPRSIAIASNGGSAPRVDQIEIHQLSSSWASTR